MSRLTEKFRELNKISIVINMTILLNTYMKTEKLVLGSNFFKQTEDLNGMEWNEKNFILKRISRYLLQISQYLFESG